MGRRISKPKFYIYVDLDGVLCDFDSASAKLGGKDKWRETDGFCRDLEAYPGAESFIARLEKTWPGSVRFLTAPINERTGSYSEKADWVKKKFPDLVDRLIIARDKSAVGSVVDFLIDDHLYNGAAEFRGTLIRFKTEKIPDEYVTVVETLISAL